MLWNSMHSLLSGLIEVQVEKGRQNTDSRPLKTTRFPATEKGEETGTISH